MKKVSVTTPILCPSKDVFKILKVCLLSIRDAIDEVDGEWFLVDDGSPYFDKFFLDIADVYIRNRKNRGVSVSLNRGMKISSGDFLVKLDSDYLVPKNLFQVLLKDWRDGLGFISPSFFYSRPRRHTLMIDNIPTPEGGVSDNIRGDPAGYKYKWGGGILMFSREAIKSIGYFDEGFKEGSAQDNDVIYRIISKGYDWRWTRNVLTRHFASISSTDPNAPLSRGERRNMGKKYFTEKHGFPPGGFIRVGLKNHDKAQKQS